MLCGTVMPDPGEGDPEPDPGEEERGEDTAPPCMTPIPERGAAEIVVGLIITWPVGPWALGWEEG